MFAILFGFILFVVTSCSLTDYEPTRPAIEDDQMSIKDAKSTLGNLTNIGMINTKGSESNSIADVSGNEIYWDAATEARLGTKDQVEVPFSRKAKGLIAVHEYTENGIDTSYTSVVTQKLIFHRNTAVSDSICLYVMSLIPDKVYNEKHSGDISSLFANFGEKSDFSGFVLYNNYQTGNLREIAYYMDGKQEFLFNLGYGDKATYDTNIEMIQMILGGIKIYRESTQTRAFKWDMDEITVYGNRGYDGIGPNWGGSREVAMESCFSEGGGGGGSSGGSVNNTKGNPNVKVENGKCVLGTIASAIQFRDGGAATKAIKKAEKALKDNNIDPEPIDGNNGVSIAGEQVTKALKSLGFELVPDSEMIRPGTNFLNEDFAEKHFQDGGIGVGWIGGETGHLVLMLDFSPISKKFQYYDSIYGMIMWKKLTNIALYN